MWKRTELYEEGNVKANVATLMRTSYKHKKLEHMRSALRKHVVLCGGVPAKFKHTAQQSVPSTGVDAKRMKETEKVRQSKECKRK